jgi:hypothetical protein
MGGYRVFLDKEIVAQLRTSKLSERQLITRVFDQLADEPHCVGDYTDADDIGREIQVIVLGRHALYFWSDHAVKEVKVIGMKTNAR